MHSLTCTNFDVFLCICAATCTKNSKNCTYHQSGFVDIAMAKVNEKRVFVHIPRSYVNDSIVLQGGLILSKNRYISPFLDMTSVREVD